MAHITLSIADSVYEEMKKHPEIKWSEIARAGIIGQLKKLRGSVHSKELLSMLSPDTQKAIHQLPTQKAAALYRKMVKEEWKEQSF